MKTLKVSVIASVIGTGAWLSGLAAIIWPAHPMLVVFILTIVATIVAWRGWPAPQSPK